MLLSFRCVGRLQWSNLLLILAVMARQTFSSSSFDPLNHSISPPLLWSLLKLLFLTLTPTSVFWTVGLLVHAFLVALMIILYALFPSTDLWWQHSFPALKQALCMDLFFKSLSGLQSCLSVGCIDLVSTHSPAWLHLWRFRIFNSRNWGRDCQTGLRVRARVSVLRICANIGCLDTSRVVTWAWLCLGNSLLLDPLWALWNKVSTGAMTMKFVSLVLVQNPVRGPLDIFIPGQPSFCSNSWWKEWIRDTEIPLQQKSKRLYDLW